MDCLLGGLNGKTKMEELGETGGEQNVALIED